MFFRTLNNSSLFACGPHFRGLPAGSGRDAAQMGRHDLFAFAFCILYICATTAGLAGWHRGLARGEGPDAQQ